MRVLYPILIAIGLITANTRGADGVDVSPERIEEAARRKIADYEKNPTAYSDEDFLPMAKCYARAKNFDKAATLLERFLRLHPENLDAIKWLGIAYLHQSKYDESTTLLLKARDRGEPEAVGLLARAYFANKQDAEFRKLISGLERFGEPARSENLKDLWREKRALELAPDARDRIVAEFEKDPVRGEEKAILALARAYMLEMKFDKAEKIYRLLVRVLPDRASVHRGLGGVHLARRELTAARDEFQKAWSGGDDESLSALASVFLGLEDYQSFKKLVPEMLKRKKENLELVNWMVTCSLKLTPHDKALFQKAIDGITNAMILTRKDSTELLVIALREFGELERSEDLAELWREKVAKVQGNDK